MSADAVPLRPLRRDHAGRARGAGAPALRRPGAQSAPDESPRSEPQRLAAQAVDVYDTLAHLEASGLGDAAARKAGHSDAFEHARMLLDEVRRRADRLADGTPPATRLALGAALRRVVTMLAGVPVCLAATPPGTSDAAYFLAGALGWLAGQTVSAATWHGLGTGQRAAAVAGATRYGAGILLAGVIASAAIGRPSVLAWMVWSMAASVLIILTPTRSLATWAAAAGLVCLAALLSGAPAVALSASVLAVAVAGWQAVAVLARDGEQPRLRTARGAGRAVVLAIAQTLGQLTVLGVLLLSVSGPAFVAVAIAGLVTGASADPLLEVAYARVRGIVANPVSWRAGRRSTGLIGGQAILSIIVAAGLALLSSEWIRPSGIPALLGCAAITLVGGLTAGCGLLLRAGSADGAATLAAVAALGTVTAYLVCLAGHTSPAAALLAVGLGISLISAALAVSLLSHPSAW